MATKNKVKFGKTDWNDPTPGKKQVFDKEKNVQFMTLENGSNVVRIITDPQGYICHKYKVDENDKSEFGSWVKCSMPLHQECVLCDMKTSEGKSKFPQKNKWYVGVIERKSGQAKILDMGSLVYEKIKGLNNSKWGDPKRYDVDITKDENAAPANYYNALPEMPEALTESDLTLIKKFNLEDLEKRCTPPEPKWVLSKVNVLREKKGLPPLSLPSSTEVEKVTQVVEKSLETEELNQNSDVEASSDDDDFFPPVN